ncbi:MAG: hypothetical protein ABGX40_01955 [Methylococcales bacterium]|jgi:predicted nucleotidyltransferase|nr:hypothetical protein [Methylococcaceae bacterium]
MFLAKDFIETAEGLVFAVVDNGTEQGKALCFLRYMQKDQQWKKVDTAVANQLLSEQYPQYLYFSASKEAYLHAVSAEQIMTHYQPRHRLKQLLNSQPVDDVEVDLLILCRLFAAQGINLEEIGVTGSILISVQQKSSDIDLVFYCREAFHLARQVTRLLIQQGECAELSHHDWEASYDRRGCDLTLDEYLWHEQRKYNKVLINQRKVDLSFVSDSPQETGVTKYKKLQAVTLKVRVTDDSLAFDYPSSYAIHHPQISFIICYTATYTGQAKTGEWIEVSGVLEQASDGIQRIVVGSSREARGEYIKVVHE